MSITVTANLSVPSESGRKAAGAMVPIEACAATRADPPAPGELIGSMRSDAVAEFERLVLSQAEGVAPAAAETGRLCDAPFAAEFGQKLIGDYPLIAEKLAAIVQDPQASAELLAALQIDASSPTEAAPSVLVTAEAMLPLEISRRLKADPRVVSESRRRRRPAAGSS